jgi:hypothetical protein
MTRPTRLHRQLARPTITLREGNGSRGKAENSSVVGVALSTENNELASEARRSPFMPCNNLRCRPQLRPYGHCRRSFFPLIGRWSTILHPSSSAYIHTYIRNPFLLCICILCAFYRPFLQLIRVIRLHSLVQDPMLSIQDGWKLCPHVTNISSEGATAVLVRAVQ